MTVTTKLRRHDKFLSNTMAVLLGKDCTKKQKKFNSVKK